MIGVFLTECMGLLLDLCWGYWRFDPQSLKRTQRDLATGFVGVDGVSQEDWQVYMLSRELGRHNMSPLNPKTIKS